jgi:hypothetical protein
MPEPDPADLHECGGDCHPGRDKDVAILEGDEKEDDREEIKQKFHGMAGVTIRALWLVSKFAVHSRRVWRVWNSPTSPFDPIRIQAA